MDSHISGGGRKTSGTDGRLGSGSRTRRLTRRRQTTNTNTLALPDPPKQQHLHSTTNFPLFSSNLLPPKPVPSQTAKSEPVSSRTRKAVTHAASLSRGMQFSSARSGKSPTPVEEVVVARKVESVRDVRKSREGTYNRSTFLSVSSCSKEKDDCDAITTCSEGMLDDYDPDVFPIQYLPDDCKLKIFSYLSSHDKGRAAQVSTQWRMLMQTPFLWSHVSFSDFPFWCITTEEHNCLGNCYVRYRVRVKQFLSYLKNLSPILRRLEFKFDIGEESDGFLKPIEALIDKSITKELRYACVNWKETPMRPFWTGLKDVRCDEVMQKHRMRQRLFVQFFDLFTKQCPKLETLVLPFDWSDRSVECLVRLKNITSLVLEKYFVFQKLCQDLVDQLLLGLPKLKQLMLEVWTPSGHGLVFFSLVSKSIEYLDISQSRGFYINAVHLPCLREFRVERHPWNGPLVLAERINVPCLYDVLSEGASNLQKINEHYLEPNWQLEVYPKLEEVLKSVCSCRRHKAGWMM